MATNRRKPLSVRLQNGRSASIEPPPHRRRERGHAGRAQEPHRRIGDDGPAVLGDPDRLPSRVTEIEVDRPGEFGDADVRFLLGAFEHRLGLNGLDCDLQGVRVHAGFCLLEVTVAQPQAKGLAAHPVGFAVPGDGDICERIAIGRGCVEQGCRARKFDQHVRLLRPLFLFLLLGV
jgi:hypothetical protein